MAAYAVTASATGKGPIAKPKGGGGKWIPPLPHGWEARYDEDNKAYFFIDHIHKKTQWEDPRFHRNAPETQPHQQAQATSAAAAAVSSLGLGRGPVRSHDAILLKDLNPRQHLKNQSQNTGSNVREDVLSNEVDPAVVNRLKAEFSNATKELITDMLNLCHNNERETREQLADLGFLTNNSKGKAATTSPVHKAETGAAVVKSPDRHPLAAPDKHLQAGQAASLSRKELLDADKKKIFARVKMLFPKVEKDVIQIALNDTDYNIEEAKILLAAWEKSSENSEQARAASAKSGSSSVTNSASSVRVTSPASRSLEPVGLDDAPALKPKNHGNSQSVSHTPVKSMSSEKTSSKANILHNAKKDAASSKSSCSHHARAKQVTMMSEHLLNTTNDLLNHIATTVSCCNNGQVAEEKEEEEQQEKVKATDLVKDDGISPKQSAAKTEPTPSVVTSQPTENNKRVTSQYRTEAKGPDASLRKGPDSSLLISDYTQASGPDKSLYAGPDKSRLAGPQKAAGPDVSLRCGPQTALLQENSNNNIISGVILSRV